jgi:Acyl-protein synthetase, LuxE
MSFDVQFDGFASRLREFIRSSTAEVALAALETANTTFERLALELFALQFQYNIPYRRFCKSRGASLQTISSWREIPAVPTSAFKELELSCLSQERRIVVFYSSGTTEHRQSRHFHNARSLALYESSLWHWFAQCLGVAKAAPAPTLLLLTPPPAAAPHSSLVYMFDCIRRRAYWAESVFLGRVTPEAAWVLNLGETAARLKRATAAGTPVVLLGTAFSFVHLLDYLEHELRFELPPGSRLMETGGYKGRSRSLPCLELHELMAARLAIQPNQIVCEYGMSELSSQAYDCVAGSSSEARTRHVARQFHFPPWARAQIISPETGREVGQGETGLIRVFDLANVYSVMAVQTEDLGIRRGSGFELTGRAKLAEARGCSLMAE